MNRITWFISHCTKLSIGRPKKMIAEAPISEVSGFLVIWCKKVARALLVETSFVVGAHTLHVVVFQKQLMKDSIWPSESSKKSNFYLYVTKDLLHFRNFRLQVVMRETKNNKFERRKHDVGCLKLNLRKKKVCKCWFGINMGGTLYTSLKIVIIHQKEMK